MNTHGEDVAGAQSLQQPIIDPSSGTEVVAPEAAPLHDNDAESSLSTTQTSIPRQSGRTRAAPPTQNGVATPHSKADGKKPAISLKRKPSTRLETSEKRRRVSARGDKPTKVALPHHPSIDDLDMPQSQVARLPNGEPDPDNLPWAGVDYKNSMVIFWHDEQKKTNPVVAELFGEKFSKKVTPESARRRHLRAVQQLANKHGLKPGVQVSESSEIVDSSEGSDDDASAGVATPQVNDSVQATPKPAAVSKRRPNQSRVAEKQHIVDLRLAGTDWTEIRDKLEGKYDWSLGIPTIRKYFDERRAEMARENKAAAAQEDETPQAKAKREAEARAALRARADALFSKPTRVDVRRRSI